jgi:hypothetical protein
VRRWKHYRRYVSNAFKVKHLGISISTICSNHLCFPSAIPYPSCHPEAAAEGPMHSFPSEGCLCRTTFLLCHPEPRAAGRRACREVKPKEPMYFAYPTRMSGESVGICVWIELVSGATQFFRPSSPLCPPRPHILNPTRTPGASGASKVSPHV